MSLKSYLKAVCGEDVPLVEIKNKKTGEKTERIPFIIQKNHIETDPEQLKKAWKEAKSVFNEALSHFHHLAQERHDFYIKIQNYEEKKSELDKIHVEKERSLLKSKNVKALIKKDQESLEHEEGQLKLLEKQLETYQQIKHSVLETGKYKLKKLFTDTAKSPWGEDYDTCLFNISKKNEKVKTLKKQIGQNNKILELSEKSHIFLKKEEEVILCYLAKAKRSLPKKHITDPKTLLIDSFFNKPFIEQQLFSPNFSDKEQELRDDVFVAAIKLQKAFIDAAAKPIGANLNGHFSGKIIDKDKENLTSDLRATLSLIVPVISTTFASVSRMFSGIGKEEIGWLLIDEAGQAAPQQAAGAIYRSKRVVSVGDPLQIQPISTLPVPLAETLARNHGVDPKDFIAPHASTQVLSDRNNPYGADLRRNFTDVRIGAPLLVHRRCEDPMFKISNELAYDNLMVHATKTKPSVIKNHMGKSHWINISGTADDKWCPEEGDEVLKRLLNLTEHLSKMPDLYIISPFKIVARNMKRLLLREKSFFENYGVSIYEWSQNHVGTVHTFQGKEAEAVIFLLGAPDSDQNDARSWATSQINILNVAVSRAKQAFYIVGNHDLWAQSGNMNILSKYIKLPIDSQN